MREEEVETEAHFDCDEVRAGRQQQRQNLQVEADVAKTTANHAKSASSEWNDEGPGNTLFSGTTKEHAEAADLAACELQQPRGKDALNLDRANRSSQNSKVFHQRTAGVTFRREVAARVAWLDGEVCHRRGGFCK